MAYTRFTRTMASTMESPVAIYSFGAKIRLRHLMVTLLVFGGTAVVVMFIISKNLYSLREMSVKLKESVEIVDKRMTQTGFKGENTIVIKNGSSASPSESVPTSSWMTWGSVDSPPIKWDHQDDKLKLCSYMPPNLSGSIGLPPRAKNMSQIEKLYPTLKPGGHYQPKHCRARHKVAIVIPYRDRDEHLRMFLEHMHWFLQKQELDYAIFVAELASSYKFNRAMLMNIGYTEAKKVYDFDCYVFHDVDLLPENDRNIYSCPDSPRHLSVAVNSLGYKLPYMTIFGGVTILRKEQFELANGYSNKFFGWGGEDDDMYNRIVENHMTITRYTPNIARYKMLSHKKDVGNPDRIRLLNTGIKRWKTDGLNSLRYIRFKRNFYHLYTRILVAYDDGKQTPGVSSVSSDKKSKTNGKSKKR